MKKLINEPRAVVREMLEGLCDLHPGLALLESENVVVRADLPSRDERPVAILSGGGSGHEPAPLLMAADEQLRRAIGGSSGPSYSTALLRLARHLPAWR